ncbi:hypothetical protein [Bradyrhizobium valentinum]|uniref:Uncharacterized protein n=1 Tax=Bradyrhizobium valentinum TaxID=1518501 RepID=A0A0R3M3L0_9BRAD|nr:hypothetical protein [Bradyrhizobium valentinum]KRR14539.1 hypothetical protein CP49_25850 [Bradyrhizobium valentinum]
MTTLTETDRDALQRAFDEARRDPVERKRIDRWLGERDWASVAQSRAVICQEKNLHLAPWQLPPTSNTIANHLETVLLEPYGSSGRRESGEILRKMLQLGLSRFEPHPLQAIAEAEQRQAVK